MASVQRVWVRVKTLDAAEKAAIAETCRRFIDDKLMPRFLPEIKPTSLSYPVAITGGWRGSKYGFAVRYRSGFAESAGEEFSAPFTRLDHLDECLDEIRFNVMWQRHNGQWWPADTSVTLEEALHLIETKPLLQPRV